MNIKTKLLKSLNNDFMLKIYAIILAILIWFLISVTLFPEITKSIENIPVTISLQGTTAEANMLKAFNYETENINVKIKGMRYEIGNYTSNDLTARLVLDVVNKPGKYDLKIAVTSKDGHNISIESNLPTISVIFDEVASKTVDVIGRAPDLKVNSGFTIEEPICTPSSITVTGPKTEIDKIDRCVVTANNSDVLSESFITSSDQIAFYDGTSIIDINLLSLNETNISIEIPVYMRKTLPLKVEILNAPTRFDISSLKYTLSNDEIDIAAPNGTINDVAEILLGNIDLRKIDLGSVFELPIELQSGYKNLSGFETVTVTFDDEGLSSKIISIDNSQINVINRPVNYNVSVQTVGISNIKLIGPKNIIDNITSADVVAQVNLLNENISESTYSLPCRIYCEDYPTVWAYDIYNVALKVTAKTQ